MKKVIYLLLLLSLFLITGCTNPVAVTIVEDMYTEALMEEDDAVATYFNPAYLVEHPIETLSDELAVHAQRAGGIKLLNAVELTRNLLNPDIVKELDEIYSDDWFYVALDVDKSHIMTWIVLKTSTQYEIVDGEKMTVDAYNNDVLK